MPHPILELLSEERAMSGPELLVHYPRIQRPAIERDLEQLIALGRVIHCREQTQGVTISTFRLPEGSRRQRSIFDLC